MYVFTITYLGYHGINIVLTSAGVGLMAESIEQMDEALNGPNGYKDGNMYEFEYPEVEREEPKPTPGGFTLLNVPGPGGLFDYAPKGSKQGLAELKNSLAAGNHLVDVCGGCGAKAGKDGALLLLCAKCKKRKYCSRECQAKNWKLHKKMCEAPKGGKENEVS